MTNAEKKAIKESLKKGIAIWKKDIQFWQQKKKEAEAMIAHDKKRHVVPKSVPKSTFAKRWHCARSWCK